MNNFLKESRKFLNLSEALCIVIGNESCDLDSAVCSLSLAYYYHKNIDKIPTKKSIKQVLTIFNIPKFEFTLKTEVKYFLKENNIDMENILFKDEINEDILQKNSIILVDHHVSRFNKSTVSVYDHRPFDSTSNLPDSCEKTIQEVGSCSTLIANLFLQLENPEIYLEPLKLLYGAIILDTVNFSKDAEKAKELDFMIIKKIEEILKIDNNIKDNRKMIFENLVKARCDVSTLNSYEILFKDMKLIANISQTKIVAIPGYPILVQDYIKLDNSINNILKFANKKCCSVILLMGMKITNENVERDLGLININDKNLFNIILHQILHFNKPSLDLHKYEGCKFLDGVFFKQNNIKISRKQILPIVKSILDQL